MTEQKTLGFHPRGGGTHEFTAEAERVVRVSKIYAGSCNLFLRHASASPMTRGSLIFS